MDIIKSIEAEQIRDDVENYSVGDTVRVNYKIIEGKVERIQAYDGVVIAINNAGISRTVTVRKNSFGVGVERIIPIHSPKVSSIDLIRRGKVRRSKLYYLRDRIGKAARIKQKL